MSDEYVEPQWCSKCAMWHEPNGCWRRFFLDDRKLMVHDWPEMGPGAISTEEMYQAFKARFIAESSNSGDTNAR